MSDKKEKIKLLVKYTIQGRWDLMEPILQQFPELANTYLEYTNRGDTWKGFGLLHYACFSTGPDSGVVLEHLISDYNADVNMVTMNDNGFNSTPLLFASANGKYNQVKTLLLLGANKKIRNKRGKCAGYQNYCCSWSGARIENKQKILHLLDNPPPKYVPHTNINYHFNKLELCTDEPDEPVADD